VESFPPHSEEETVTTAFLAALLAVPTLALLTGTFFYAGDPDQLGARTRLCAPPKRRTTRKDVLSSIAYYVVTGAMWLLLAWANVAHWKGDHSTPYVAILATATILVGSFAVLCTLCWLTGEDGVRSASLFVLSMLLIVATPAFGLATYYQWLLRLDVALLLWLPALGAIAVAVAVKLAASFDLDKMLALEHEVVARRK
jgi:hypothetical protein